MIPELFKPTFLYVKKHTITGKLYFGKTTVKNPDKYLGSGSYWVNHITKHGKKHVETLWYCLFIDQEECTNFAIAFSAQQNICSSDDWLNIIPENGLGGRCLGLPAWNKGMVMPKEQKEKLSKSMLGVKRIPFSGEHKRNISESLKGKLKSKETRNKISISCLGNKRGPQSKETIEKRVLAYKKTCNKRLEHAFST